MSVAFQALEDRGRELVSEDYILWLIALMVCCGIEGRTSVQKAATLQS